ncbi:C40 family peptidase [uncultured Tessaracoccus sp.]|uniref:C40 family peptidase n=1 Tax=uncultured Tessaracoccus sp. TaxID=905023 RepID=UPI002611153F|nr:C40 family peptidase [uncultured Tessaracoccus sp.]
MKLTRLALTGLVVGSLLIADSAFADPDAVREAKAKLDALNEQVSSIEQEGIDAEAKAKAAKVKLERAQADVKAQEQRVAKLADDIGANAVFQMQHGGLDVSVQLIANATDDNFLSSLATIQAENDRANQAIQRLQNDQARLDVLRSEAASAKQEMDENVKIHDAKLAEYKKKQSEAEAVYDRLNKEEQERLEQLRREQEAAAAAAAARSVDAVQTPSRSEAREDAPANQPAPEETTKSTDTAEAPAAPAAPAPNGNRAQTVINAAMAQVGKRYVLGGTGPSSFDCSGLTSYAFRQVGVGLPRTSRGQYAGAGRAVPTSQIQPGDLVFYYGGPSHVAIYIGGGKIVHAANPRSGIRVAGLHSMPLKGVRRVL